MANTPKKFQVRGEVADGEFFSQKIDSSDYLYLFSITFYDDSGFSSAVTPTAGTATFYATDDGYNYGLAADGEVDATSQIYMRPSATAVIEGFKVALSGVTGATHFVATARSVRG